MIDLDPSGDPHAAAEAAELRRDLASALIDLPFKYRAAVVLRHVMGLDYAEAALQMGVPLNTFKSHLLRGTRMLREALAERLERPEPSPAAEPAIQVAGRSLASGKRPPPRRCPGQHRATTETLTRPRAGAGPPIVLGRPVRAT